MRKSPPQVQQGKRGARKTPTSKHVPGSPIEKTRRTRKMPFNEAEAILKAFPESIIVCDWDGKILWINAAARMLFELPETAPYQGIDYQQFLERYLRTDSAQHQCAPREQWLMNLVLKKEAASSAPEHPPILHLPSGREVAVTWWRVPMGNAHQHLLGTAYTFHDITYCHQIALHLQGVHEAVLALTAAIAQIPEQGDLAWPEAPLLATPVIFAAQQLVNVIRSVLDCQQVFLLASQPLAGHLHYVTGSGLTSEQEQFLRESGGDFLSSGVIDETIIARLRTNQETILPSDRLRWPTVNVGDKGSEELIMVPLFLEQQWAGALAIVKAGVERKYSPEEVELVKVVAALAALVVGYLRCMHARAETRTRDLVLKEVQHLSNNFLTLASHELRTPLTGIMGNLQLAQQRLEILKGQVAEQAGHISERIGRVQQPLASASQSARLLQRMINDLIDDARIQTNQLALSLQPCDLLTLLKEVVTRQQHAVPEQTIVFEKIPTDRTVPVFADAGRIKQVLTTYLTNALDATPAGRPVTVALAVKEAFARVSVHDEGPGIPAKEQVHLWDRFYRGKGSSVQHELDLSFGLGLYLCKAFIERQQGSVGVQSAPGQGTTFWFTLPLAT